MKSKLNIKSILIVTIIAIITLVSFNQCFAADVAKINVDTANIRKKPDATSAIVEQAYKGEDVEILEKTGEWYKVKYNKVEGYLRKDLISEDGQSTTEQTNTSTSVSNTAEVNTVAQNTTEAATASNTATSTTETKDITANVETAQTNTETEETSNESTSTEVATEVVQTSGMYTCRETTKLKLLPLIFGKDIKNVETNSAVNVLEINNNWALVESGSDRGWILINKLVKESNSPTVDNTKTQVEENKEENKEEVNTEENKQEETSSETTKYVSSEVVNLRSDESTSSSSLAKLTKGTEVTVVSERNGWSKVNVDGKSGYVASSLLSERKPEDVTSRGLEEARQELAEREEQEVEQQPQQENTQQQAEQTTQQAEQTTQQTETTQQPVQQEEKRIEQQVKEESKVQTQAQSSNKGQDVVNYALQFKGSRYVYGGTSPKGFDCSGFTQYVYKHFGVSLNRTAASQTSNGKSVSRSNLQPGDIIMFGKSGINHVGIYMGGGKIVHAANPSRGVTTDTINSGYYNTNYVCARRIF